MAVTRDEEKTVQAVRGTEARTIAKWEADGWHLVDRDQGTFRTALTFRRPRPRMSRATAAAFAGLAVVAVGGLTLGAIFGDDEGTTAAPADATASSPPADVGTPAAPEPTPTETTWDETRDGDLTFGETARFRSTAGSNDIPLEITVEAPVPFTPSEAATVLDARAEYAVREGQLYATTVFFTVTVRNLSTSQAFDTDFVFSDVADTGADDQVSEVRDGDVVGIIGRPQEIPPGGSFTLKDGYSVADATAIEYTLDIDGLAGRSFSFSR
ncbi:UNVERIFIED_ORG: hypothetical protein E4P37_06630 [Bacillus sp. AZ43]